jgi:PAS domain-containing protein
MAFVSFFRQTMPGILTDLKVHRLALAKMQNDLEQLFIVEQNHASPILTECQYGHCIKSAIETFGVALWVKDKDHKFIFANEACCNHILKCSQEEALNFTDTDFENDALAKECLKSDKKVMESRKTMRFIEHAVYSDDKEIFLDIVKSPRIEAGKVVGTIGSGIVITDSIPKAIRDQHRKSNSIEIPVAASMGTMKLIELIERRKEGGRDEKDDKKFQEWRKENKLVL